MIWYMARSCMGNFVLAKGRMGPGLLERDLSVSKVVCNGVTNGLIRTPNQGPILRLKSCTTLHSNIYQNPRNYLINHIYMYIYIYPVMQDSYDHQWGSIGYTLESSVPDPEACNPRGSNQP